MNKRFLIVSVAFIWVVMFTALLAGCISDGKNEIKTTVTATSGKPVTITWLSDNSGRVLKDGDPILAEFEKKTNIKIKFQLVPASQLKNKINILVASQSLPDIMRINSAYDISQYVQQGVFKEVNQLVDKFGPNIKANQKQELWDAIAINGKYYGIPNTNTLGKFNFFIRQDWLDNLNLKMPTNTVELYNVLKKFVTDDPDKDGKANTIAFSSEGMGINQPPFDAFMSIFGAFGIQPDQYYINDNKVLTSSISPEFKEAVSYIKKLFDDKLVDPDLFISNADLARQKISKGKTGAFIGWWSIAPQILMDQMEMNAVVPEVKWGMIKDLKGPNGKTGIRAQNKVNSINCIAKSSKNAEACVKAIDYLFSNEGAQLATVGIKDKHWVADSNGKFEKFTNEGIKANEEKYMGLLSTVALTPALADYVNKRINPAYAESIDNAAAAKLYIDAFEGLTSSEKTTYDTDLKKLETDWFVKFVTGKEPLSKWDEYVKQYNDRGGKAVLDSLIKQYNKLKGTNITAAN
ncbi:MAG: extracellular solute-binding protein [Bacillota bacterium]|nr:extracellular solute-binding protein [Bacillota bacterium]